MQEVFKLGHRDTETTVIHMQLPQQEGSPPYLESLWMIS